MTKKMQPAWLGFIFLFLALGCSNSSSKGSMDPSVQTTSRDTFLQDATHTEDLNKDKGDSDATDSTWDILQEETPAEKQMSAELENLPALKESEIKAFLAEDLVTAQRFLTGASGIFQGAMDTGGSPSVPSSGTPSSPSTEDSCQSLQNLKKRTCAYAAKYCAKPKGSREVKCRKFSKSCYKWVKMEDLHCVCQPKETSNSNEPSP